MKFKKENIIGILNFESGKILVRGTLIHNNMVSELEIELEDSHVIVLGQFKSMGEICMSTIGDEWINFVMIE